MSGLGIEHNVGSAFVFGLVTAMPASAANPIVDRQAASPIQSITREELERLPAGQRIEDLLKTCPATTFPTVTRDTRLPAAGSPISNPVSIRCLAPADLEMIDVYRTHNAARAEYGASPLARDPLLELSAADYAGQLARSGKLVHAPREGRGNIRENISQGLRGWSAGQLLGSWLNEKKNFVPGTFPNVSRTGNWFDIGHWSQMIWAKTVVIGCARAAGIGSTWMVCRYGPGGNRDGDLVGVRPAPAVNR